jgi:hypothetical protein
MSICDEMRGLSLNWAKKLSVDDIIIEAEIDFPGP